MTTITGTFKKPDGSVVTDRVRFRRLIQPAINGSTVVIGWVTALPDATAGAISVSLFAGDYAVFVGESPEFITITVPDSGTADVADIAFSELTGVVSVTQLRLPVADGSTAVVTGVSQDGIPSLEVS